MSNDPFEKVEAQMVKMGENILAERAHALLISAVQGADLGMRPVFGAIARSQEEGSGAAAVVICIGGKIPLDVLKDIARYADAALQDIYAGDPNAPKLTRRGLEKDTDEPDEP